MKGKEGFQKGEVNNPHGRPRKPEIQELREALKKAQAEQGKSFLEHFVKRAFKNDMCAIALARKLLPDKIENDEFKNVVRTFLVKASPGDFFVPKEKLQLAPEEKFEIIPKKL